MASYNIIVNMAYQTKNKLSPNLVNLSEIKTSAAPGAKADNTKLLFGSLAERKAAAPHRVRPTVDSPTTTLSFSRPLLDSCLIPLLLLPSSLSLTRYFFYQLDTVVCVDTQSSLFIYLSDNSHLNCFKISPDLVIFISSLQSSQFRVQ